jgi:hypothetical protein
MAGEKFNVEQEVQRRQEIGIEQEIQRRVRKVVLVASEAR